MIQSISYAKIVRQMRTTINALMIAALLAGLIPPPLVPHVVDMTDFQNLSALLAPSVANAAPLQQQATVPNTEIMLSVHADGTEPFSATDPLDDGNGGHTPGADLNANNNVVRTFDLVHYRIDWNVNEVDASNVVLEATLPGAVPEAVWVELPAACQTSGVSPISTISNNGQTLTCNLGDRAEGSSGAILPTARVDGTRIGIDGDLIPLTATIDTDQTTAVTSNAVSTTISAVPNWDWVKAQPDIYPDITNGGTAGTVYVFPIFLKPSGEDGRGVEPMDDTIDIQFADYPWQFTDSVELADASYFAARAVCGGYDGNGAYPYGQTGLGDATNMTAGVVGGTETINCSVNPPSGPRPYPIITLDIAGHDSQSAPPMTASGARNKQGIVISAQLALWVSNADLQTAATNNVDLTNSIAETGLTNISSVGDITSIQIESANGSIDEATTANNSAVAKNYFVAPANGSINAESFVRFDPGRYRERLLYAEQGYAYRSYDYRNIDGGGYDRNGLDSTIDNTNTWDGFGETPRGNIVTIAAAVNAAQDTAAPLVAPLHGCVGFQNEHLSLIPFSSFDILTASDRAAFAATITSTVGTASDGPLAHVHTGYNLRYFGFPDHGTIQDNTFGYVVEFAESATPVPASVAVNDLTCLDADASAKGWVAATDTTNLAQFDVDNDGTYELIDRVRVRMLEPIVWELRTDITFNGAVPGTEIRPGFTLYLQAQVNSDRTETPDGSSIRAHISRAYGAWDGSSAPAGLPYTQNNLRTRCFSDPLATADPGFRTTTGFCNLPYATANEGIGLDNDGVEVTTGNGLVRVSNHDRINVVDALPYVEKRNVAGFADVVKQGDTVTFLIEPRIDGAMNDTLTNVVVTDTLDTRFYELVSFAQPTSGTGTCTSPAVDIVVCDFGSESGGWADDFTVTARVKNAPANMALPNVAIIKADDRPADIDYGFAYTLDGFYGLDVRKNVPDINGSCISPPGSTQLAIGDCSLIDIDGVMTFTLDITNTGAISLNNISLIDVLPHLADENEAQTTFSGTPASSGDLGDGRTPESAFSGTTTLLGVTGNTTTTVAYSSADPATISRDPSNTVSGWTTNIANATAFSTTISTLEVGEGARLTVTIDTGGNALDDIYTNNFGGRAAEILLPNRSNDVSVMPFDPAAVVSIGNQVWIDGNDNGLFEVGEDVIPNLLMELWVDVDGDGIAEPLGDDGATATMTMTTSASGQYSFTNLAPGNYFVRIPTPPVETPLSSIPLSEPDNGVDNDDNGIQPGGPNAQVLSPVVNLTVGDEPGTAGGGNDDHTIDFGLVDPFIGNLVWHDQNNNGLVDIGEPGIGGVTITVLYDGDASGGISGSELTPYRTTQTDSNGLYVFPDLLPNANYQIVIPIENFQAGGALETLPYSTGPTVTADNQIDEDDNGIQSSVGVTVTSPLIRIDVDGEPVDGSGTNDETGRGNELDNGDDNNGDMTIDFGFYQQTATPSIAVDKQLNSTPTDPSFSVGETISFTIRITNTGDVVIDTLPLEDRYSQAFLTFDSALPAETNATGGIITWDDLLVSDGDGLGLMESVSVVVTFTTEADTTLLPALPGCSSVGHTPNLARSVGATSSAGTVVEDADDSSCDHVQILNPTAVQLANRSISQTPDGVMVRWETVNESNLVGFHIWKANGVNTQQRSSEMVVATRAGQPGGSSYQWLDAGAALNQGDAYVLEAIRNDGTTERAVIGVQARGAIFLPMIAK